MKNLVVFDLDHTLLRANCSFAFGSYLFKRRRINFLAVLKCLYYYTKHRFFSLSIEQLHKQAFHHLFKDFSIKLLRNEVNQFLKEHFDQLLYSPAIKRLNEVKSKGDYVLLLSSSPDFLVAPIAQKLGIPFYGATIYAIDEKKKLAAVTRVMDGKQKASYLKHELSLMNYPLASIDVYSDSHLDLPLLKIAKRVIAVNPTTLLKKLCVENHWEIL